MELNLSSEEHMFKMYRLYCNTQTQSNIKIIGYKFTSFVLNSNKKEPIQKRDHALQQNLFHLVTVLCESQIHENGYE